jgi:phosphohistidine phosphatase SixA
VLEGEGHAPKSLEGGVLMDHLQSLHAAEPASQPGPVGALHFALDDFHDAAAKGDEDRYFGLFAPESVFIGTDATERWTLDEFRTFALPYFQRGKSAWIYVPRARHVQLSPDGQIGWFDEELGHARLGLCRGTGVVRQIDGAWRVAQYVLTVPIPNDLMGGIAERIHAFSDGATLPVTTVLLVRHAEKTGPEDDATLTAAGAARAQRLAEALRSAGVRAVFTSQFRRTQDTAAPLCKELGIEPEIVGAHDIVKLVRTIRADHGGETVLVVGHSNTVPEIAKALGVAAEITIGEKEHDDLFAVTLLGETAGMLRLRLE